MEIIMLCWMLIRKSQLCIIQEPVGPSMVKLLLRKCGMSICDTKDCSWKIHCKFQLVNKSSGIMKLNPKILLSLSVFTALGAIFCLIAGFHICVSVLSLPLSLLGHGKICFLSGLLWFWHLWFTMPWDIYWDIGFPGSLVWMNISGSTLAAWWRNEPSKMEKNK